MDLNGRLSRRYSRLPPRHSRESGNPESRHPMVNENMGQSQAEKSRFLDGWQTAPCGADTLILAFSHKGRRDALVAIQA